VLPHEVAIARSGWSLITSRAHGAVRLQSRDTNLPTLMSSKTIFQRIIDREIPADIVFEDDLCLAFRDVRPQAPVHVLVIPKQALTSLAAASDGDSVLLGHLLTALRQVASQLGLDSSGYRVVINCGPDGGQTVDHLHLHLLGGRRLGWPPG
jgi:histidine triad (HIT) family protein